MNATDHIVRAVAWMPEAEILASSRVCKKLDAVLKNTITHRRLCRYERIGEFDEGTYSFVFPVLDLQTRITYIMKRLKKGVEYVLPQNEAACLEHLRGKAHIIQINRSFFSSKNCYEIVMEYFKAPDLQKQMNGGPFTKEEIVSITKQILMALNELGSVIHSDIKPANILWDRDKDILKLIDFGSAHPVNKDDRDTDFQTPCYRAPEVVLGCSYDQAIDMWSVGCVIYQLCTLELLFAVYEELGDYNKQLLSMFIHTIGFPPNWGSTKWIDCRSGTNFARRIESEWREDPNFAKDIIDLLKRILCYENRITPQEALNHRLFFPMNATDHI